MLGKLFDRIIIAIFSAVITLEGQAAKRFGHTRFIGAATGY